MAGRDLKTDPVRSERNERNKKSTDDNPFVAFRQYADEQISSLLHSFIGVPTMRSDHAVHRIPASTEKHDTDDSVGSHQQSSSWHHPHPPSSAPPAAPQSTQEQHPERCPVLDSPSFLPALLTSDHPLQDLNQNVSSILSHLFGGFSGSYHPGILDATLPGMEWQKAWEDLCLLQNGEPMRDWTSASASNDEEQDGGQSQLDELWRQLQWMAEKSGHTPPVGFPGSVAQDQMATWLRGLPFGVMAASTTEEEREENGTESRRDGCPHQRRPQRACPAFSSTEELSETELDWYQRMLSDDRSGRSSGRPAQIAVGNSSPSSAPEKPSVVATLTTTKRVIMPDGKIHTTVVLKNRFSDGREENTETTHTAHAEPPRVDLEERKSQSKPEMRTQGESKKGGWFWRD